MEPTRLYEQLLLDGALLVKKNCNDKKEAILAKLMSIRNQRFSVLKQPIFSTLNQHLIDYPTPSNISYWWGFGSLAGICLVIQIVTGVFLAMHYTPHVDLAFNSVEQTHYERC